MSGALVTLTFNKPVTVPAAAINAPNCVIGAPFSGMTPAVWYVRITPVDDIIDLTNRVTLDLTLITDDSGDESEGASMSANYTVNTLHDEETMIDIDSIPANLRVPGTYIEIDGSLAGLGGANQPSILLVGNKFVGTTAIAGTIALVSGLFDVGIKCGAGSMLYNMAKRLYAINPLADIYILPFVDNASGAFATATIECTTAPTADGTLSLYLGGQLISVSLTADMDTDAVATAIHTAVNAYDTSYHTLPARSTLLDSTSTLTARHRGTCGNQIDLRINARPGDQTPTGLVLDITGFSGGTLIPTAITDVNIQAIFDADTSGFLQAPVKYIALGHNDAVTMQAFHLESQRRYLPPIQSGFRIFTANNASYSDQISYGQAKNGEHISCLGLNDNGSTAWEAAAIYAAVAGPALYNNPVKSLEGKVLKGLTVFSNFQFTQQNSLLFAGISTVQKSRDGTVTISRAISMYQHRTDDTPDDAFLDINTAEAMERIRYTQRLGAIQRFRGKVAAGANDQYRAGLPIVNVDTIRAYLLALYKNTLLAELGWVRDYEWYKDQLIIEQDPQNPSRFNYIDAPVINSPFYILAGKAQFRKLPE